MSDNSDFLFSLVRSLTPSEKRHFTIYASRHTIGEENNSIRMFRRLDALKEYNERKFLFRNAPEDFTRNFRFNKHFLYRLILRSLHAFHSGKTAEAELREQLHHIDILTEKGLFDQAQHLIDAAKGKAERYQFHAMHLELLSKEVSLLRDRSFAGRTEKEVDELFRTYDRIMSELRTVHIHESRSARMSVRLTRKGLLRSQHTFDELEALGPGPSSGKAPEPYMAAWHFHTIRLSLFFFKQDHLKALREIDALISLMETHPHLAKEHPKLHINVLHNRIVMLSNMGRYDEVPEVAGRIRQIPVRSRILESRKFYASHNLVMSMYAACGEFGKAGALLAQMEKKLQSGEVRFLNEQHSITHDFTSAVVHFGNGNMAAANKCLQRVINRSELNFRSDILCFALILRMIIQYEMQKPDLLEYSVRSAYRFLYKRERIYRFEDVMMAFIREELPVLQTKKQVADSFRELKRRLQPLTQHPFEKNAFAYFDMIAWLESKISGKTMGEVIRARLGK